jgi:methionyl-tRNA formyltransferase
MWQAYTPWPGIYTMYEGKRLLLEKVSLSCAPPEKGESEGVLFQKSEQTHPNPPFSGRGFGTVVKLDDGTI